MLENNLIFLSKYELCKKVSHKSRQLYDHHDRPTEHVIHAALSKFRISLTLLDISLPTVCEECVSKNKLILYLPVNEDPNMSIGLINHQESFTEGSQYETIRNTVATRTEAR